MGRSMGLDEKPSLSACCNLIGAVGAGEPEDIVVAAVGG